MFGALWLYVLENTYGIWKFMLKSEVAFVNSEVLSTVIFISNLTS